MKVPGSCRTPVVAAERAGAAPGTGPWSLPRTRRLHPTADRDEPLPEGGQRPGPAFAGAGTRSRPEARAAGCFGSSSLPHGIRCWLRPSSDSLGVRRSPSVTPDACGGAGKGSRFPARAGLSHLTTHSRPAQPRSARTARPDRWSPTGSRGTRPWRSQRSPCGTRCSVRPPHSYSAAATQERAHPSHAARGTAFRPGRPAASQGRGQAIHALQRVPDRRRSVDAGGQPRESRKPALRDKG